MSDYAAFQTLLLQLQSSDNESRTRSEVNQSFAFIVILDGVRCHYTNNSIHSAPPSVK